MTERPDGQVSLFDQDTWYGKTSLVPRAANKAVTSQPSSKKQSASQSRKLPIFKCLTRDGQLGGGYRDVDGRWSVAWRVLDAELCEASHNSASRTAGRTLAHGQMKRGNFTRNHRTVRGIRHWETP